MEQLIYGPFISLKQAREHGCTYYWTGKACSHGHVSIRTVSSRACHQCETERQRRLRAENPEHYREVGRRNDRKRAGAPKRIASHRRSKEAFEARNPGYMAEYQRKWIQEKRTTDVEFRLLDRLRKRLWDAVKGLTRTAGTEELLGCTIPELRVHLASMFEPGMGWDNYGEWDVDHIRPCATFNLTDPDQQRECFHYSNLQTLWESENCSKGDRWDGAA